MTESQREVVDIIRRAAKDLPRERPVAVQAGDLRLLLEALDQATSRSNSPLNTDTGST